MPDTQLLRGAGRAQEPIKEDYPGVSYADLIVMAGNMAIEHSGGKWMNFCPGRVDAHKPSDASADLELESTRVYPTVIAGVRDRQQIMGLSMRQAVALAARPRSPKQMMMLGYSGSYSDGTTLSNKFYKMLLTYTWEKVPDSAHLGVFGSEYKAVGEDGKDVYVTAADLALVWDPEYKAVSQEYAYDNDAFLADFAYGWTALMDADRNAGPTGSVCS